MTAREVIAIGGIVLSVLIIVPGGQDRFTFGKLAVVAAAGAVALLAPRRGRLPRLALAVVAFCAFWFALATLTSTSPLSQLIGRGPRYEGLVALPVYACAGIAGARLFGPGRPRESDTVLLRCLTVAAIVVGFVAVLESAGLRPLASDVTRPGSLLGNASDEGAFGLLALGVLLPTGVRMRDRWAIAGSLGAGATVALSGSRAALIGLLAIPLVSVWALARRRDRAWVGVAVVGVVALALLIPATRHRATGTSPLASETTHGRTLLWHESTALFAHHIALGVGGSGFEDAIPREHDARWYRTTGTQLPPDSPHSWPLQAALAGGLPLLAGTIALGGLVLLSTRRKQRSDPPDRKPVTLGMAAALSAYAVALLAGFPTAGTAPLAAFAGGALLAVEVEAQRDRRVAALNIVGAAALELWALALFLAASAEIALHRGLVATSGGNFAAADRDFRLARALRPWDVEVRLTAGHAFAAATLDGQTTAADLGQRWLSPARRRLATSLQVREDIAACLEGQRRFDAAERELTIALGHAPENPELLLRLGVVQAERGENRSAERTLLAVTRIIPSSPDPWRDLALLYRQDDRSADAAAADAQAHRLTGHR